MKKIGFLYILFACTIFLGSFLLFQVQPIIGKYILPWYGGASFVWVTSLLFFQTLLLGGYLYAYFLTKLPLKPQAILHSIVIFISFCLIIFLFHTRQSPITPGLWEKPSDIFPPTVQILIILLISVGLPYFLLSTTSTLLQKWLSIFSNKKSPYSLYAVSNVGSLLGLMSYPFVIEPTFSLQQQGIFWSNSFLFLCIFLFLSSGYVLLLYKKTNQTTTQISSKHFTNASKKQLLLWFILPAISSLMLLAATNQLTLAVAPIPFLWLLPLSLYLISFIVCFSRKNLYQRSLIAPLFLLSMLLVCAILLQSAAVPVLWQLILYSILLFSAFMLCHGELYSQRPKTQQLNVFYLFISLGSVLGALIVAVIAPIFFVGLYWELYLGLYMTSLVALLALVSSQSSLVSRLLSTTFSSKKQIYFFLFFVISGLFFVITLTSYEEQTHNSVGVWRNFYGTLRVTHIQTHSGTLSCLSNGKIIHGCEFLQKKYQTIPLTYYGKESGVQLAIQRLRNHVKHLKVGVIGLGVGTLAAYGHKGDTITFYELNPQDSDIARSQFRYLSNSQATISIISGDGRLSLAKEMSQIGPAKDNLLVIDAFNDDSIPMHLLTKEAFDLYRQNISATNSIIAVHISTTYVDLEPVIKQLARHFNMSVAIITTPSLGLGLSASRWALLTSDPKLLQNDEMKPREQNLSKIKTVQLWTDNYSNVFQLLNY